MEISSTTEQPRKVKNILVRYSCSKEMKTQSFSHHPEKSHLLKYFPKYYKNLTLEVTSQNPLLSKIKRIKKLQTFTGALKQRFPFALLRTLLGNNKKCIEDIPKVICEPSKIERGQPFWAKLTEWKVKFFPNITKLVLPRRKPYDYRFEDYDDFLLSRKFLMKKYLGNMRKLKTLELFLRDTNDEGVKWMLEKLDGMEKFIERLDTLRMEIHDDVNIQELFKNRTLISKLTSLGFYFKLIKLEPSLMRIPEICKRLRSLSIGFRGSMNEDPEFPNFLTSLQNFPRLVGLEFFWTGSLQKFWVSFKPPACLRSLKLRFDVSDLKKSSTSTTLLQELLGHWEDINEMDEIEFILSCDNVEDLLWIKMFMTMVLIKVRKLSSFKCWISTSLYFEDPVLTFEPFFVEQVPHLYENLQGFEFSLRNSQYCPDIVFDLKKMKVFKNLKELRLGGARVAFENIEEMVILLEEGQKQEDYPLLELQLESGCELEWFKKTMEKIYKAKRKDRNLKTMIDLCDRVDHMAGGELKFLDGLCDSIQSVGLIRGLFVNFEFSNVDEDFYLGVEDFKEIMSKYGDIRNLVVKMQYFRQRWEYRRLEGEKKQFLLKNGKIME